MTSLSYTNTLTNGTTADASQVMANFNDAKTVINGGIDATNLTAATAANLGLTRGATSSRGKSIIATVESTASTTYTTLATPDKVTVTLPTDGLLFVAYHATWAATVDLAGYAAIFVGASQLTGAYATSAPVPQEAIYHPAVATQNVPLYTCEGGLYGGLQTGGWSDVSSGQLLGGMADATVKVGGAPATIFLAAGTYDITVQFKASSGSVNARNRKMWCWTMGFD